MSPTVYLFDIDGTLVTGNGAGRRALKRVFERRWGRPDALDLVDFGGATDRGIMREALAAIGVAHDAGAVDEALAEYAAILPELVGPEGYRPHRGVIAALDALRERPGIALGLGTGNIELGARAKLAPAGLNPYFAFGGFGSDAEDRGELLEVGARRGAARLGAAREACRVLVIGDTPRDVAAARAIGAACVAVATGWTSADDLRAAGADVVVEHLEEAAALAALLATG
ncbi:MAG: HAD family hydrolase [Deltaproteobacteria bacterium]|nr:HAD family hydrolase [Deltaproteobacteria bacterium]